MDRRERQGDAQEALRVAHEGALAETWTALPGIIQSFDVFKQTCVVQPALRARVQDKTGAYSWVPLPLLLDVPVQFPRGGGVLLTFPVAAGDECLVHFADRCIDAWWQSGGIQNQAEMRMHDLSDGFAALGYSSVPRVPAGISTTAASLRAVDNLTRVTVDPAGSVSVVGKTTVNVTAPTVNITGTLIINGEPYVAHVHTGVTAGASNTGGKA